MTDIGSAERGKMGMQDSRGVITGPPGRVTISRSLRNSFSNFRFAGKRYGRGERRDLTYTFAFLDGNFANHFSANSRPGGPPGGGGVSLQAIGFFPAMLATSRKKI